MSNGLDHPFLSSQEFIELADTIGIGGAVAFTCLLLVFIIFTTWAWSYEKRFKEIHENYNKELDRQVEEKKELIILLGIRPPSSTRGEPSDELKEVLEEVEENNPSNLSGTKKE